MYVYVLLVYTKDLLAPKGESGREVNSELENHNELVLTVKIWACLVLVRLLRAADFLLLV